MSNDIKYTNSPGGGKALAGIVLLTVGIILLLRQFIIPPDVHIELWPLWLIGGGLYVGARSNFNKSSAFWLIGIGAIFLLTENIPNSDRVFWPLAIIAFGLWMILRRNHRFEGASWKGKYTVDGKWQDIKTGLHPDAAADNYTSTGFTPGNSSSAYGPLGDDYLDAVSVFGGVKKTILSKDFKGGEIVNIFGGAELDFTQADINGRVIIDITQIFGGSKIIVPSHWQVVPDMAAVFAGIDDKRMKMTAAPNSDKVLVIKGVSVFAGVDIRSF